MLTITLRIHHNKLVPNSQVQVTGRPENSLDGNGNPIAACKHELFMAKVILSWIQCQQEGMTIVVLPAEHTDAVTAFLEERFPQVPMINETEAAKIFDAALEKEFEEHQVEQRQDQKNALEDAITDSIPRPKTPTKH